LREISEYTRISIHYLEAIETNDYKRLPGGIFNRSFVKAYARYVGYDEKEAVDGYTRYMRELGVSSDDVPTTPHQPKVYTEAPATRSPFLTVVLAIVILAVLTALALTVLHWVQRRSARLRYEAPVAVLHLNSAGSSASRSYGYLDSFEFTADTAIVSLNNWKADYEEFFWQ
jgi:cytoskeletal protein RodZ